MRNKVIPESMIQSEYVAYNHPCTVVTITDNSQRPVTQVNSENYTVLQPVFMPKGPTDEIIVFEGSDIVTKWRNLMGTPNTTIYGKFGTIAEEALKGRFSLATLNMRPPEATYANFYVAFTLKKAMDEEGDTPLTKTLYVLLDSSTQEYTFSFVKTDLQPEGEELEPNQTITEVPLEMFEIGFKPFYIEDLKTGVDYAEYLSETLYVNKVGKNMTSIDEETEVHLPLFALAYKGRGDYGNVFKAEFSTETNKLNDAYSYYNCAIKDGAVTDYSFTFTTFDIAKGNLNYGFGDRALLACRTTFTATNFVQVFNSYSASRQLQNKVEASVKAATSKVLSNALAKVKEKFPSFNETTDTSNWGEIVEGIKVMDGMFKRNRDTVEGKSLETPFSYVDPWLSLSKDIEAKLPWVYKPCPATIPFVGGTMGPLADILDEDGFDWNSQLEEQAPSPETGLPENKKYKIWNRMLINFFKGITDDCIFDPTIVRDAIVFADDYPDEVQEVIDDFTRYREGEINFENGRCDMCFIRTPDRSVKNITEALDWQGAFLNKTKNINMHPVIGAWRFTDPSTGSQETYQAFFDYLGTNSSLFRYLSSCVPDSFASGDWSMITKGAVNSMTLVPRTHAEREELANRDIIYYKRRPGGYYTLGHDTGYNIGMDSVLKSIGSNIQFNRILNLALMELLKNQIINPTKDRLAILQRDVELAISQPAKHFNGKVSVSIGVSTHEKEVDKKVVLCEITVTGHEYSRSNRLHMIAQRPDTNE